MTRQMIRIYSLLILTIFFVISIEAKRNDIDHKHFHTRIPAQRSVPRGWRVSWTNTKRLSNGKSQGFLSLFTVDKTAKTITTDHVNRCVQTCSTTQQCGFVNLLKLQGSSLGNVVCMMYPRYHSKTGAKYTSSPQKAGGKVEYSYGIRSDCAPINGKGLVCSPQGVNDAVSSTITTTMTTSTTRSSTSTSTSSSSSSLATATSSSMPFYFAQNSLYPSSPRGATLVQWAPCSQSQLTNPAMANSAFIQGSASSTTAYIVQHGAGSDFYNYFAYLYQLVGNSAPIVSAGFMTDDASSPYYIKGKNLAWSYLGDSWSVGNDDSTGVGCSSFSQYDAIINYYANNPQKFPNLQNIVMIGHSGGGNMISRFSTINNNTPKQMRYVIVNAANQAYFEYTRPINQSSSTNPQCGNQAYDYPYQWNGLVNNYIAQRVAGKTAENLFTSWSTQDVIHLTGDEDISTTGTQACPSLLQGGPFRRDRNYAYWAYLNMLAGTSTNVTAYYGYANFTANNLQPFSSANPAKFDHQQCTVAGIGHDGQAMFQSDCGQAAIFGYALPPGAGASYPSPPPPPPSPSSSSSSFLSSSTTFLSTSFTSSTASSSYSSSTASVTLPPSTLADTDD